METGSERITEREAAVLELVAQGRTDRQIAAELGVTLATARKHRENVQKKTAVHNSAGLVKYYFLHNWHLMKENS